MFLRRFLRPSLAQFAAIYGMLFFFSAQVSLSLYTNSSFLSDVLNHTSLTAVLAHATHEQIIGLMYGLNAIIGLITLINLPRLMRRLGNFRVTLGLLSLSFMSLAGLAWSDSLLVILPAFVLQSVMVSSLYLAFDVFLERYAKAESVGLVRGTALTIGGIAWMFPPSVAGIIAAQGDYTMIYAGGMLLLFPALLLLIFRLRGFKDPPYHVPHLGNTIREIRNERDIAKILSIQFLLQFFYAWMIIYTPLYLAEHLGISWSVIGLAITIALSAFVLFEIPAGELADKVLGEKELLIAGLSLMALGAFLVPFTSATALLVWGGILFIGRSGASIVETMTETYFFKHVRAGSTNLISSFRLMSPIAFLIAPSTAAILLSILDIQYIFFALSGLLLLGVWIVSGIRDTR